MAERLKITSRPKLQAQRVKIVNPLTKGPNRKTLHTTEATKVLYNNTAEFAADLLPHNPFAASLSSSIPVCCLFCILKNEGGRCLFVGRFGRKHHPSADDIKDILGAVGAESDDDKVELLLSGVKGKDINELIAAGREKLASVPSGGGAGIAVASAGPAAGGAAAAPAAAEAKKEEKVEEKEESDDDMGFSLFD